MFCSSPLVLYKLLSYPSSFFSLGVRGYKPQDLPPSLTQNVAEPGTLTQNLPESFPESPSPVSTPSATLGLQGPHSTWKAMAHAWAKTLPVPSEGLFYVLQETK